MQLATEQSGPVAHRTQAKSSRGCFFIKTLTIILDTQQQACRIRDGADSDVARMGMSDGIG
jgi:hypothetical protein